MIYLQIVSGLKNIEKSNLSKVSLRTAKKCLIQNPSKANIFTGLYFVHALKWNNDFRKPNISQNPFIFVWTSIA